MKTYFVSGHIDLTKEEFEEENAIPVRPELLERYERVSRERALVQDEIRKAVAEHEILRD